MINRRILLSSLALLPILQPRTAIAQRTKRGGNSAFSFASISSISAALVSSSCGPANTTITRHRRGMPIGLSTKRR